MYNYIKFMRDVLMISYVKQYSSPQTLYIYIYDSNLYAGYKWNRTMNNSKMASRTKKAHPFEIHRQPLLWTVKVHYFVHE